MFDGELLSDYIYKLSLKNEDRYSNLLVWLFEHKDNFTEDTYNLFFKKVNELIGTITDRNKLEIVFCY